MDLAPVSSGAPIAESSRDMMPTSRLALQDPAGHLFVVDFVPASMAAAAAAIPSTEGRVNSSK